MPTDTRSIDLVHSILCTSTTPQGVMTITASGTRVTGTETTTRTYVQERRRPKGWKKPKPYIRQIWTGVDKACVPFFASGRSNGSNTATQSGLSLSAASFRLNLPSFDGGLANRALIDAKLKLKDQKVNFGVAFAERAQTADMVASNLSRIAKAYRDARKGHFRDASRHLGITMPGKTKRRDGKSHKGKELHDAWLELQFGWKPLLSDIYGAAEALREKDRKGSTRYGCTVKSRKSLTDIVKKRDADTSDNAIPLWFDQRMVTKFDAFIRLDYYRDSPELAALAQTGFTNPLEIAWELVPFSFVVDWVAPIGRYLSILDAELGWKFRDGSLTRRQVSKRLGWCSAREVSNWDRVSVSGTYRHQYKVVNRTVYTSSPTPAFSFKNPASGSHLASALALLAQAVGR